MKMLTRDGKNNTALVVCIGLYLRVGELPVVVKLPTVCIGLYLRVGELPVVVKLPTVCIGLYLRVGELPVVVKLPAARDPHGRTRVA